MKLDLWVCRSWSVNEAELSDSHSHCVCVEALPPVYSHLLIFMRVSSVFSFCENSLSEGRVSAATLWSKYSLTQQSICSTAVLTVFAF